MMPIEAIMLTSPVIPVLVVEDASHAAPIAQALVSGGLRVLEVTLRTPSALDAIREMKQVPGAIVGAGTVTNARDFEAAMEAGSEFIVSPGITVTLASAVIDAGVPMLPGIATAGDMMLGMELGLTHFKFFPAMAAGGIPAIKAFAGPFPQCRFCPTGGITQANARDWLDVDPVLCVGGSWLVPKGIADLDQISHLARQASALKET